MKVWNSMLAAIGMYTRIPVKNVDWTEENMCYMLCFVPLVGVITGALQYGLWVLCGLLHSGNMLFACAACCIPLLVTGGIHMDGFCDTVDALSSYRVREKRLEILKDPHIGSFAVMGCCCFFLLQAGCFSTVSKGRTVIIMGAASVLARCVGCLMAVSMKNARKSGSLWTFCNAADKSVTAAVLVGAAIFSCAAAVWMEPLSAMFMILGAALCGVYCVRMAVKEFGGVTGDIIGYSIQVMELSGIAMTAMGGMSWNL